MHVAIERARALSYFSALTITTDDPRRRLSAMMAKAAAGEAQSLVVQHGMAMTEGTALAVLARQANRCAIRQYRSKGQRLGLPPIDATV